MRMNAVNKSMNAAEKTMKNILHQKRKVTLARVWTAMALLSSTCRSRRTDMRADAGTMPYRMWSRQFLSAYITTMRPYLLFVSGITGIVGLSFIHELTATKALLVSIASFLSYGFGQALTDCFQVDTDSLSAPYRPLTHGAVSKRQVLSVSLLGLGCCTAIFAIYNPLNLILGFIAGMGLATYTTFKRTWWGGPFYNAWIVVVLCVMAFMTGTERLSSVFASPFALALVIVFFGYANFVLSGYFKDIDADRKTGYRTLPVVCGRKLSAVVSDALMGAQIAPLVLLVSRHLPSAFDTVVGALFALSGVAMVFVAQVRLHKVTSDAMAHSAITPVVHGYVLILSSIVCLRKPEWSQFLIIFYAGFLLVMKARPARNQI